jgi:hypothetical protein
MIRAYICLTLSCLFVGLGVFEYYIEPFMKGHRWTPWELYEFGVYLVVAVGFAIASRK